MGEMVIVPNPDRGRRVLLTDADYRYQADFRYALSRFLHVSADNARTAGVTPQQHLLLLAVRGHPSYPAVTIGEVAEYLQVRHHSASLLIERAIRRGAKPSLLHRVQDSADRRRALVSLTPEGEDILERITIANRAALAIWPQVVAGFPRSPIEWLESESAANVEAAWE